MNKVEKCYQDFWAAIVEKNGEIDMEEIKKELYDYRNIIREVSIVYDTLTMGNISKPNTEAQVVIDEVNRIQEELSEETIV